MLENTLPIQWLHNLFCIQLASIAASLLSWLPIPDVWLSWVQKLLIAATVYCLFQLADAGQRYRKAAIFRAVYLGCLLVTTLLFSSNVIMLGASVFSLLSLYQEYSAHSELIARQAPALSRKWHSLFNWSIAAAVLVSFGSMVVSMVAVLMGMSLTAIVNVVMILLSLPQLIVNVFYLMYLNRTAHILQEE